MKTWGLLKFGAEEHIEQLVDEGIVYCNTVAYFRDLECDAKGDPCEGLSAVYGYTQCEVVLDNKHVLNAQTVYAIR